MPCCQFGRYEAHLSEVMDTQPHAFHLKVILLSLPVRLGHHYQVLTNLTRGHVPELTSYPRSNPNLELIRNLEDRGA